LSKKAADNRDGVIALLEDESAGNEAGSPLVFFRPALSAISGDVFLRDSVDDRSNSRPHAGTCTHGTGLVRGIEDEVRQVVAIAA